MGEPLIYNNLTPGDIALCGHCSGPFVEKQIKHTSCIFRIALQRAMSFVGIFDGLNHSGALFPQPGGGAFHAGNAGSVWLGIVRAGYCYPARAPQRMVTKCTSENRTRWRVVNADTAGAGGRE